ncbi:hypothetical protein L2725_16135 [Shewanella corallii]|uniref:PDZ domain-containing protein n=1 Tax=Shewanella corallii TaxID=560080 RepID=A0ABT0NA02_9GAMM|nr:hypothetical protein [Shewanella corallii]MCL2915291.1 hypothetical protein [Shewanella corallii]
MVRQVILSGLAGVAIGYGAAWMMGSDEVVPQPVDMAADTDELKRLRNEVAMQQLENELLMKMVKAGLKGDIAGHMETYRQLPGRQRADTNAAGMQVRQSPTHSDVQIEEPVSRVAPDAFISRIQQADVALQKQALSEGWAMGRQLSEARRELWQEAKETLNEQEYLSGLHAAGLPNMLYFAGAKSSELKSQGLEYGDVLTHVAGIRVFNRDDLRLQLENFGSKSTLELTFSRKGDPIKVQVTDLNRSVELHGDSVAPDKLYSKARRGS